MKNDFQIRTGVTRTFFRINFLCFWIYFMFRWDVYLYWCRYWCHQNIKNVCSAIFTLKQNNLWTSKQINFMILSLLIIWTLIVFGWWSIHRDLSLRLYWWIRSGAVKDRQPYSFNLFILSFWLLAKIAALENEDHDIGTALADYSES